MVANNWLSNTQEKYLKKYIPKASGKHLNKKQQAKIIKNGVNITNIVVMVLKAIFYIYLFQKAYKTIGFEQTAILLLTIIMIVLKNKR